MDFVSKKWHISILLPNDYHSLYSWCKIVAFSIENFAVSVDSTMSFPLTKDEITINLQMLCRQWRRRRATSFSREYKSYDRRRVVVCGADRGAGKEMRSNRFPLESARMEHTYTHTHSRWVRSHPVCCFTIVWSRWISLWMAGPWRFLLGTCWTQSETFQIGKSFSHTIASE